MQIQPCQNSLSGYTKMPKKNCTNVAHIRTLHTHTVQTLCLLAGGQTDILGSSSSNLQNTFCLIKQAFSPQQLQWSPLNIDFFVSGNWAFQILICSFSQIRLCIVYILCIYICMHTKSWLNLPPIIGKSNLFLFVYILSLG